MLDYRLVFIDFYIRGYGIFLEYWEKGIEDIGFKFYLYVFIFLEVIKNWILGDRDVW